MDLQKINIKLPVKGGGELPLKAFIPIFNAWIQASDGYYYDLADYSHMPTGPGLVLVADEANFSLDQTDKQLGLLYNRKRPMKGSNGEKLLSAFRSALQNCRRLEDEPALGGRFKFWSNEALVFINDRLRAPNTEDTFRTVKPELEKLGQILYGGAEFAVQKENDLKRRFGVRLKTAAFFEAGTLLENIESAGGSVQ
ncbi:MAG: hypothetical protein ACE5HC_01910 [Candidatus Binatia bacterium]